MQGPQEPRKKFSIIKGSEEALEKWRKLRRSGKDPRICLNRETIKLWTDEQLTEYDDPAILPDLLAYIAARPEPQARYKYLTHKKLQAFGMVASYYWRAPYEDPMNKQ